MRKIKKIVTIFMIAAVAFTVAGTTTSIRADDTAKGAYSSTPGTDAVVKITKEIVTGERVSLDAAATFTFSATLKEVSTGTYTDSAYANVSSLTASVNFAANASGNNLIAETSDIFSSLGSNTYPHAGIYVYTVTETTTSASGYVLGGETYTMYVYVYNTPNNSSSTGYDGTYIHAVTVANGNLTASNLEDTDIDDKKVSLTPESGQTGTGFRFKSYYNEDTKVALEKKVEGDLVSLSDEYDFTVVFTFPSSVTSVPSSAGGAAATGYEYTGITYTVTDSSGTISTGTATGSSVSVSLKAGETVTFSNLPAGTTYTVTESVPSGFVATAEVTEQGTEYKTDGTDVQVSSGQAQVMRSGSSSFDENLLAGEMNSGVAQNKVVYTNTETDVSITGLIIDNLPFIALMGVGIVGLVYIALNKKRKSI